jgi:16S rRNA (cytidine1402-2'-O)-methyltransferase
LLEGLNGEPGLTLVFYESPHRILESLRDVEQTMGDPPVAAGREVTKLHEEFLRGKASEVRASLAGRQQILGEFTLIIGKREPAAMLTGTPEEEVASLIHSGMDRMEAIKTVAKAAGIPKRELYKRLEAI